MQKQKSFNQEKSAREIAVVRIKDLANDDREEPLSG